MLGAAHTNWTPKGRHTQDWAELTRVDFTKNVPVEFLKEPQLEKSSSQRIENPTRNQSWKTLRRSRLGGTNRHLKEQSRRVEQRIGKDGRRWLSGDETHDGR